MMVVCIILVLALEATNGFHNTSNTVATVFYTHALKPIPAVLWSGLVLVGAFVAFARNSAETLFTVSYPTSSQNGAKDWRDIAEWMDLSVN
jgi:phosphate/sulfate permease